MLVSRRKAGTYLAHEVDPAMMAAAESMDRELARARRPLAGRPIQLVTRGPSDASVMGIFRAAQEELEQLGAVVVPEMVDGHYDLQTQFEDRGCDLVLMVNPSTLLRLDKLPSRPTVVASTSWHPRNEFRMPCDLIGVDQFSGAALAGEALRKMGGEQACYLGRRQGDGEYDIISSLRLDGFEAGWGRPLPQEHRLDCGGYSVYGGGKGFGHWMAMSNRPTNIFTASDDVAVGFCAAAAGQGLIPGRDYQLIGFDGLALGQSGPCRLTTVQVPFEAMGRAAANVVKDRLFEPDRPVQTTYLGCRLLIGDTALQTLGPS